MNAPGWAKACVWRVEADLLDVWEMTRAARTVPATTGASYRAATPPVDAWGPELPPQEKLSWILAACDRADRQLRAVAELKRETGWARPRGWRPGDYEPTWCASLQKRLDGDLELVELVRQSARELQAKLAEFGI